MVKFPREILWYFFPAHCVDFDVQDYEISTAEAHHQSGISQTWILLTRVVNWHWSLLEKWKTIRQRRWCSWSKHGRSIMVSVARSAVTTMKRRFISFRSQIQVRMSGIPLKSLHQSQRPEAHKTSISTLISCYAWNWKLLISNTLVTSSNCNPIPEGQKTPAKLLRLKLHLQLICGKLERCDGS